MKFPVKAALKKLDKAQSFFNLPLKEYMTMREQINDPESAFWARVKNSGKDDAWQRLTKYLYDSVILTVVLDLRGCWFYWSELGTGNRVTPELDKLDGDYELALVMPHGGELRLEDFITIHRTDDQDKIVSEMQVSMAVEAI